ERLRAEWGPGRDAPGPEPQARGARNSEAGRPGRGRPARNYCTGVDKMPMPRCNPRRERRQRQDQTCFRENPMSYSETLLPEFDHEMSNTRKVLERIPDDKLDWQAHPKSRTIGWNANHVADLPNWLVLVLAETSLDIAPVGGEPYSTPKLGSRREILELF